MIDFKKYITTKPKRYAIGYISYQHAARGTDDYEGWQDFHTFEVLLDREAAYARMDKLKQESVVKDVFLAEEVDIKP